MKKIINLFSSILLFTSTFVSVSCKIPEQIIRYRAIKNYEYIEFSNFISANFASEIIVTDLDYETTKVSDIIDFQNSSSYLYNNYVQILVNGGYMTSGSYIYGEDVTFDQMTQNTLVQYMELNLSFQLDCSYSGVYPINIDTNQYWNSTLKEVYEANNKYDNEDEFIFGFFANATDYLKPPKRVRWVFKYK